MNCYWLQVPLITGRKEKLRDGELLIIGSGLSGVSCAYWLQKEGFSDITLVDFEPENAASFRNCGHILYGTVESMQALESLYGQDRAASIWKLSVEVCHQVRDTVLSLGLECDYRQNGYLCLGINEAEDREIQSSVKILNSMGFQSDYLPPEKVSQLGFKNLLGARFEKGSAQAHPVRFRNGLLRHCLEKGLRYLSGLQVTGLSEKSGSKISVQVPGSEAEYDGVVIAANAYSPLFSSFFSGRKLVEPFRGQIIVSEPLEVKLPVSFPHSFDHGYEYALGTEDNRLMIGGWRNHSESGEKGTYDLNPNPSIEEGLKEFVNLHYNLPPDIKWEFSWSGIMGGSSSGFPLIGPTDIPNIYTCAGFTGHGFSWAHGSAKILADIISGKEIREEIAIFRPVKI